MFLAVSSFGWFRYLQRLKTCPALHSGSATSVYNRMRHTTSSSDEYIIECVSIKSFEFQLDEILRMVDELRAKWCEDLEELLQCPVCYERPKVPTLQCLRGHHICNSCKDQMTECPLCKCRFSEARSYLAEELSTKLDDIKLSLIYPSHKINQKHRRSIASQTDTTGLTAIDEVRIVKRTPPPAPRGEFPCRFKACNAVMPHGRMLSHIRYYHGNKLYESRCTSMDTYTQVWQIEYAQDTHFDLAIRVTEMGLFFMLIEINRFGDLFGLVQIVSTDFIGKDFKYELTIGNGRKIVGFTATVRSCYTQPSKHFKSLNCLVIENEEMQLMIPRNKTTFTCNMTLIRLPK